MSDQDPDESLLPPDDADTQERESAMLVIWALLGLLLAALFSLALWA